MSEAEVEAWDKFRSMNRNAPQIGYLIYHAEKVTLGGYFISSILHGIAIVLFFRCVLALFNHSDRTRMRKLRSWGIMAYIVAMFSFVALNTAIQRFHLSIAYVDNREFPGAPGVVWGAGPLEYMLTLGDGIGALMYCLNSWLVDVVLVHRCWIIYAMNYWVITSSCLLYLASGVIGFMIIYQSFAPASQFWSFAPIVEFDSAFLAISFTLNVLLTVMIIARLAFHNRNIQRALGALGVADGLYKAIITMLIESFSLYATAHLAFLGSVGRNPNRFFGVILTQAQVTSSLLIVYRVASRSALTNEDIISGSFDSIRFRSQGESTDGSESNPEEGPINLVEMNEEAPSEPRPGVGNEIEEISC